jgi:adenosylcobinamide kinase/adenosylcobinamide-phosphate guanylyltransferase
MLTLVLGGARSGKSRHGQGLAEATGLPVCFIATAEAGDAEMAARIARHRAERPAHWRTVEEARALGAAIAAAEAACVLVDCLTLWLANWLCGDAAGYDRARADLLAAARAAAGDRRRQLILVANEVGLGVVPMGELNRRFVDEAGRLNQDLAGLADSVVFLAAGLPLIMKGPYDE